MFTKQLDALITEYHSFLAKSQYDDASDVISDTQVQQMITRALAAIERSTGRISVYTKRAHHVLSSPHNNWGHLAALIGICESTKLDIDAGYMTNFEELIHADVFSDFLEMSDYLVSNGYKDPAAVIAGSTLEAHLKQLCAKNSISIENNGKPKKADTLNADLAKASVYSKLDQKNITAWLGLRNNAAHGNYRSYDQQQVQLLVSSIRDFITRIPA